MNRATHTVVLDPDKGDFRQVTVTGWHLDMDESVIWDLISTPAGHPLRWWRCKPHCLGSWKGEWSGDIGAPFNWKADNEDQFFLLLVNGQVLNAVQGASDASVTNNGNAVGMTWHGVPGIGEVNITVVAR
jgi:hypothetical protein